MSLSIDDDWLKPTEDQRDAGPSSSVTGGKNLKFIKSEIPKTKTKQKFQG